MSGKPIPPVWIPALTVPRSRGLHGEEDLSDLLTEADALRRDLGYSRFSHLSSWCDGGSPLTCDGGALERMIERLCILWAER